MNLQYFCVNNDIYYCNLIHSDCEISSTIPGICQTFPSCEDFKGRIKLFEVLDSNISNSDAFPSVYLQLSHGRFSVVPCSVGCLLHLVHFSGCVLTSNVLRKRSSAAAPECFRAHEKVRNTDSTCTALNQSKCFYFQL